MGLQLMEIPLANKMISSDIEKSIKDGLLKKERSDGVLMDIRHTKLVID